MISVRKTLTFIVGLALTIGVNSVAYSDAAKIAELSDSISKSLAARNWDAADAEYEEIYSVYQSDHGTGSRQALAMAKVLGQWKIQAYRSGLLSKPREQVIADASAFYSTVIAEAEQQQGASAADLIDPLYGQAMVAYHLLQIETRKPINSYLGIGPELIDEEVCVDAEDRGAAVICDDVEVPSRDYIDSQVAAKLKATTVHWDAIAASLQRIAAICKQNQYLLDEAEALTHLGDLHLAREEESSAIDSYNSAYQALAGNADPEAAVWMQRLFTTATIVPSLSTSFPGAPPAAIPTHAMTFGFNIMSNGKAEDVEVLSGGSRSNRAEQQSTIDIISSAKFRPHFDENGVVDSAAVEL